jgi:hypothetical protein
MDPRSWKIGTRRDQAFDSCIFVHLASGDFDLDRIDARHFRALVEANIGTKEERILLFRRDRRRFSNIY